MIMKILLASVTALLLFAGCSRPSSSPAPAAEGEYVCTMDDGRRATPGPCPKCGMELTEKNFVKKGEEPKKKDS